ncbi:uncharacterized protein LOC122079587 [Macadamia integrifolia]|uniref:uncharacterized protein LOC122079587 n=1 Tax=Macadamia integrifolia TaxID=60698 RepID=UPI001C4E9201|nr:uncharacterized protein LOC122079587 [Macadamia integrifolia]
MANPSPTPPNPSPTTHSSAHHFISLKLTSKNYVFWCTQIVSYLTGQRLLNYVTGDFRCPQDPVKAKTLREQDASIMSLLIASLSDEALSLAVGRTTSKEIWDAQYASFSSPSTTWILSLNISLQNLVHKPDETITQFLHRVKSLSDELAVAGKPLPQEDFNIHVFLALRTNYQALASIMMAQKEPISYNDMHGLLMSHETLIQSCLPIIDPAAEASAHVAYPNRGPPTQSNGGRDTSSSRGRGRGRGFGRSNAFAHNPCTICGRTNHQTETCYYRQ